MKKIGFGFLAVLVTLAGVNLALAQESISAEKTALVKELFEVQLGKQSYDDIMDTMFTAQRAETKKLMDSLFADDKTMSAADKAKFAKMVEETVERLTTRAQEYFTKKFDFDKFVNDTLVPAYARHFTENELRDMIAFHRSPVGQKLIEKEPEIMAETMNAFLHFVPDFLEFMKKATDEEMAAMKQKLPKNEPRRKS